MRPDVLQSIVAMAAAAFLCRAGGYFLMRFIPITPRVEAGLRMIPLAIFGSMLAVTAAHGGPAEWSGILAAIAVMIATRNDFAAIVAGMAAVALLRQLA